MAFAVAIDGVSNTAYFTTELDSPRAVVLELVQHIRDWLSKLSEGMTEVMTKD